MTLKASIRSNSLPGANHSHSGIKPASHTIILVALESIAILAATALSIYYAHLKGINSICTLGSIGCGGVLLATVVGSCIIEASNSNKAPQFTSLKTINRHANFSEIAPISAAPKEIKADPKPIDKSDISIENLQRRGFSTPTIQSIMRIVQYGPGYQKAFIKIFSELPERASQELNEHLEASMPILGSIFSDVILNVYEHIEHWTPSQLSQLSKLFKKNYMTCGCIGNVILFLPKDLSPVFELSLQWIKKLNTRSYHNHVEDCLQNDEFNHLRKLSKHAALQWLDLYFSDSKRQSLFLLYPPETDTQVESLIRLIKIDEISLPLALKGYRNPNYIELLSILKNTKDNKIFSYLLKNSKKLDACIKNINLQENGQKFKNVSNWCYELIKFDFPLDLEFVTFFDSFLYDQSFDPKTATLLLESIRSFKTEALLSYRAIIFLLKDALDEELPKYPVISQFISLIKNETEDHKLECIRAIEKLTEPQLTQTFFYLSEQILMSRLCDAGKFKPAIHSLTLAAIAHLLSECTSVEQMDALVKEIEKESSFSINALSLCLHEKQERGTILSLYDCAFKGFSNQLKKTFLFVEGLLPQASRTSFIEHCTIYSPTGTYSPKDVLLSYMQKLSLEEGQAEFLQIYEHWNRVLTQPTEHFIRAHQIAVFITHNNDYLGFNDSFALLFRAYPITNFTTEGSGPIAFHMGLIKKRKETVHWNAINVKVFEESSIEAELNPQFFASFCQNDVDPKSIPAEIDEKTWDLLTSELKNFNQQGMTSQICEGYRTTIQVLLPDEKSRFFRGLLVYNTSPTATQRLKCILNFVLSYSKDNAPGELSPQNLAFLRFLDACQNCNGGKENGLKNYYFEQVPTPYKLKNKFGNEVQQIEPFISQIFAWIQDVMAIYLSEPVFYEKVLGYQHHELPHLIKFALNLASHQLGIPHDLNYDDHSGQVPYPLNQMTLSQLLQKFYQIFNPFYLVERIEKCIKSELQKQPSQQEDSYQTFITPLTDYLQDKIDRTLTMQQIWEYPEDDDDFSFRPIGIKRVMLMQLLYKLNVLSKFKL